MTRTPAGGSLVLLTLAALFLTLGQPAYGYQPVPQNELYEIPLPAFDVYGYESPARAAGTAAVSNSMFTRHGVAWKVHLWNSLSGTPSAAFGTSITVSNLLADESQVEQVSRQVINDHTDVLGANLEQLRVDKITSAPGKWGAHFQQTYQGLDVFNGGIHLIFAEDGRLMSMGSDFYGDINISGIPSLSEMQANEIAKGDLPFDPSIDYVEDGTTLLVLPYPLSASEVEYHLVWRVRVHTSDPLGTWVTHVDAQSGEILWRYNDIHFAYGGTTSAQVQIYGYCDGITGMTIPYLDIDVSGIGTTTSDVNGDWSIAGTGGNRSVTADLYGPYVDIENVGGGEALYSGTAQEDVPLTVTFNDINAQHDERDTFDAVNDVHEFFELFAPGFSYTQERILARVSRSDFYCPGNAWWDGTINFCAAGGSYANTGELQQVVHHEFGHGVQDRIIGGQGGEGLGEGNADILGNLITQDNIIGRGFYQGNCTSGIRNSLNNLIYPDDVIGQQIHYAGQVIAGFNWDAMVLLQDLYGEEAGTILSADRWHYGRVLGDPGTQPLQVYYTFVADDDNGNLDDGTPNHAIFCEAAENHGFECPEVLVGVFVYHDGHPYTGDNSGGYDIVGTAISMPVGEGEILPETVNLNYRVDGGGFDQVSMAATGNPDEFQGTIPAQPWGSIVEYYLEAENDLGSSGTSPRNAPDELHYFQVNQVFPDEMEEDTAWSVGASGDNANSGIWVRVDPIGTDQSGLPVQPEDDHTQLGTDCWVTGQHQAGQSAGYNDVDGGRTTLLSPRYDLSGATDISVRYWRWFSNDTGNNPGEDPWVVDVSGDDGQTWVSVENTTTDAEMWTEIVIEDLTTLIPDPGIVQFRFIGIDEGSGGSLVEAGVDDFLLTAVFDVTGAEDLDVRFITALNQNNPNPFNPRTEIRFSLAQAGSARLAIYDPSGRQVKSLVDGQLAAGPHGVVWDGTDDGGRPLATGTYFYRLETAEGKVYSSRMVLLK